MTASPGWQQDPTDPTRLRYWDGQAWTEHIHDQARSAASGAGAVEAHSGQPANGNWFVRHKIATALIGTLGVLVAIGLVAPSEEADVAATAVATSSPTEDEATTSPPTPTPTPNPDPDPDPTPTPEPPKDTDGDGYTDDEDDYPNDPDRHTESDRDGDGVVNTIDVAPNNPDRSEWDSGTVTRVIDGDTVEVQGYGTIRVIGIDTPERGECGFARASTVMRNLALGKSVTLVPGARDNKDRYDRLLRYVDVGNQDAGLQLIKRGLAIARYDSRDGYGQHPREARYIKADSNSPDRTQAFCPAPPPPPEPEPAPQPPPTNVYFDNCDAARAAGAAPVYRGDPGYGSHLDRDGDGVGCE